MGVILPYPLRPYTTGPDGDITGWAGYLSRQNFREEYQHLKDHTHPDNGPDTWDADPFPDHQSADAVEEAVDVSRGVESGYIPWEEVVGTQSPYTDGFNRDGAGSAMFIRVPFSMAFDAAMSILGYRWHMEGAIYGAHPMRHPFYENLVAEEIPQIRYEKFTGEIGQVSDGLHDFLDWRAPYAKYKNAIITVRFGAPRYHVPANRQPFAPHADDQHAIDPAEDDVRAAPYLEYSDQPDVQMITMPTGSYTFVEGLPAAGSPKNEFGGEIGVPERRLKFTLRWHNVPEDYLCDSRGVPIWPLRLIGCVNDQYFFGRRPGTVLYLGFTRTRTPCPLHTDDGVQSWYNTLDFQFEYHNPAPGAESPLKRGHLIKPYRVDLKYYTVVLSRKDLLPATPIATPPDFTVHKPCLEEADLGKLFGPATLVGLGYDF